MNATSSGAERLAAPENIDRAMELGYHHPIGPLRLGDLVGLDVRLAVLSRLCLALAHFGQAKW